jgi:hypothetical protein
MRFTFDSERFVRFFRGTRGRLANYQRVLIPKEDAMKTVITTLAAAVIASSFAMTADAATAKKKDTAMSAKQTTCHEQAKKKYSAVHFLKRKAFEKKCMGTA